MIGWIRLILILEEETHHSTSWCRFFKVEICLSLTAEDNPSLHHWREMNKKDKTKPNSKLEKMKKASSFSFRVSVFGDWFFNLLI